MFCMRKFIDSSSILSYIEYHLLPWNNGVELSSKRKGNTNRKKPETVFSQISCYYVLSSVSKNLWEPARNLLGN